MAARSLFRRALVSPLNAGMMMLWKRALHGGALERVRVVLVSPQQAGNVGSVCRVATNFDCNELWLVDPQCDFMGVEAQTMAANVTSRSKLEHIRVTDSLSEALKDCSMAVGFTRRSGVLRIPDTQLANLCIPSPESLNLALVFGREDRGLTNSELMHCTHVCSIPSTHGAGSLNLSHAVAVVLSRLYEQVPQEEGQDPLSYLPPESTSYKSLPGTASVEAVENLMRRWELVLQSCNQVTVTLGIPNYRMQERMLVHVRRMLLRTGPSLREVGFLHGFLTMVETVASRVQASPTDENPHSCQVDAQSVKRT
ncbi:hypothetical protein M758_3G082300 [Ceratodon purpureus]|nr:hypothetical protein M758_3G082300 [Ceratodon purpureus]